MTNNKMTKKDYFALIRQELLNGTATNKDELLAFVDHEVDLLAKKNSAEKKPTAVQIANKDTKSIILDTMAEGQAYTVTDLMKANADLALLSNQKISALVRQLIAEGEVIRIEDKRKAYFSRV